jgi:hypothetical protein
MANRSGKASARGRQVVCALPAGGDITVHVGELTRTYRSGDVEDLDRVLVPAVPATSSDVGRAAVTVADALGAHVEHFTEVTEVAPPAAASSTERSAEHEE